MSNKGLRQRAICSVLACLLSWLFFAALLYAAEPVTVDISGVEGAALKNVQEALALPSGLIREGKVDRLWLDRFAKQAEAKVTTALEPFGYYKTQVSVTIKPDGERYILQVKVVPGEPVHLSDVRVTVTGPGKDEEQLHSLVAKFPLHKGNVLLHQAYEDSKAGLRSQAVDLGYLDAEFTSHEIRIEKTNTTATVELVLESGEKYRFGDTAIKGAPDYPDSFLRRNLAYKPGQIFSYSSLGETQRNFANSERFKEVNITPDKQDAKAFRVPVTVNLTPGPRISLRPGIGYGTDTGARFTLRYRDLNMFHLGHELTSQLFIAERLQGLATSYIIPSSKDVRSFTSLSLNMQREETSVYFSRILALELARNRSLGKGRLGTAFIRAQYEDYTVGAQTSTARLLLPGVRFSDDRFDNPVRPVRGFRYGLELRGTHQWLGSDTALVQILAEGLHIQPLPWRLTLHTRVKGAVTMLDNSFSEIPPSLRFFTGGDQSVRGYSYKSLGPRDATGQVIGGKQLLTYSVELERALFKDWGVSLFYDAGNSFNSLSDFRLYQGAGVGLHYYTRVGALNLSVAWPLGVDNPSVHFHFTVGFEL